ncbi:hypothetical protein G5V59_18795 [Nocardioides sp. W3-2-3]|uniref:hypothetical protein n=1 Tax=Nocardioides convexus TaxID=2712224 RepID=UPI00241856B1|nr:hypothetical protein [Nocardioides convexus]NHA01210.1 hypothetical protein [Nocardioides convexus]
MTNTQDDTLDRGGSRTPQQIAELFAIAGRETEAIEQAHRLRRAACTRSRPPRPRLASLTPAEVRAALEFRRGGIGEAQ